MRTLERTIRVNTSPDVGFLVEEPWSEDKIDGLVEIVIPRGLAPLNNDGFVLCLLVDEFFQVKNLPLNPIASVLYGATHHGSLILGDVWIAAIDDDGRGNLISLPETISVRHIRGISAGLFIDVMTKGGHSLG